MGAMVQGGRRAPELVFVKFSAWQDQYLAQASFFYYGWYHFVALIHIILVSHEEDVRLHVELFGFLFFAL